MPLSQFHRAAGKSQIESTQSKMSDSTSFMPENDFVELLWENGPIVMQGQSNRQKKSSYPIPFSGHNLKIQEKGKFGQFEAIDSSVNELSPAVPCANIGLNPQDDDIAPWMNYPIEDPLCSEFFSELAGIHPNPNPRSMVKDFNNVSSEPSKAKTSQSSVVNNSKPSSNVVSSSKPLNASNSFGLMNFSHFSRPVSIARANNESLDRLKEKIPSAIASTNPMESTLMESNSVLDLHKAKVKGNKVISREDASRDKNGKLLEHRVNHQSPSFGARAAVGRNEIEKNPEPVVASSSVCSGNSAGAASNDPKHGMKRKNREVEESGYQSEDIDDESTGLKKPAAGRGNVGAKRRRAAEVHNLSERRRRDRINEKMRSLQELIPNCNKVDKASMLDEAIEYLKTLQLQVQMISMGSGLCMPPMMLPPGMQHMQGPPVAHFSPMGVGMGMGMGMGLGYHGMGMLNMNGSPMIPVSSMHTSQFHCPSIPGMPGSTGLQLFGMPGPGQGMPVSLPHAPQFFSPLSGLPPKGNSNANPVQVSDAGRSNLDTATKTSKNESQVTKESFEQAHLVQMGNQAPNAKGNAEPRS